jgi:hypothetical protein
MITVIENQAKPGWLIPAPRGRVFIPAHLLQRAGLDLAAGPYARMNPHLTQVQFAFLMLSQSTGAEFAESEVSHA